MNLKKINNPFGGLTYYKESTSSTMSEAINHKDEENIHGSIFLTDFQSNGIGRVLGRSWQSKPNENLMFTLVLNRDFIGHGYGTTPLRAGLALSKAISELTEIKAEVKWPNDVVVDGKKISGILCQSQKNLVFIGVGINVNQITFDNDIKDNTTSLSILTNNGYSIENVLSEFLDSFYKVIQNDTWLEELNNVLYRQGQSVKFAIGNPANNNIAQGVLSGLDNQGKVIIKNSQGEEKSYLSGEFI